MYDRILKVSHTIAEFEDFESDVAAMVARGIGYSPLDRTH
jgi:predicted ATPase with chaperone activity